MVTWLIITSICVGLLGLIAVARSHNVAVGASTIMIAWWTTITFGVCYGTSFGRALQIETGDASLEGQATQLVMVGIVLVIVANIARRILRPQDLIDINDDFVDELSTDESSYSATDAVRSV